MSEQPPKPLLADELSLVDRVNLAHTSLTPGYAVLVRLMSEACKQANESIVKVNPEEERYDEILRARQQYSRAINKFSALVLKSVEYHKECGAAEERQKELEVLEMIK